MSSDVEVVTVDATNVAEQGFFCRAVRANGSRKEIAGN